MTEFGYILCGLRSSKNLHPVKGSTIDHCVQCHEAIIVAPSSRIEADLRDLKFICVVCGTKRLQQGGGQVEPPNARQVVEMFTYHRKRSKKKS